MMNNFVIKNIDFSISGMKTQAELVSCILGNKEIFSIKSEQPLPDFEGKTVISDCQSIEEYVSKAEQILKSQKDCVMLSVFNEGFIAFTLETASSNSEGYAFLQAEHSSSSENCSLRDTFFKLLKASLEIRFYMNLDTKNYKNLVFSEFPYKKNIIAGNLSFTLEEMKNQACSMHQDENVLIPVNFSNTEELKFKLKVLEEKLLSQSLHSISEEALQTLGKSSQKTVVFCIKCKEMLSQQIGYVLENCEKFMQKNYLWKMPSGSFYINSEKTAKIAFCNPPGGMYNRENFFRLYLKLNGLERTDTFSSYSLIQSDDDFIDRYLYDVVNTFILINKLLSLGISADYFSGMSMGEISYFINKKIVKLKNNDIKDSFEIISSALAGIVSKQYELADSYFGKRPEKWSKYYLQGNISKILEEIKHYPDVFEIIIGSPRDLMICGEEKSCTELFEKVKCVVLKLDEPFFIHTPVLALEKEHIKQQFLKEGVYADASAYHAQLFSTASAEPYQPNPEWFAENVTKILTEPVNYPVALEKLYSLGTRIFIDISTNQICTSWMKETLKDKEDAEVLPIFSKKDDNGELFAFISRLISYHVEFDYQKFFSLFGYHFSEAPNKMENIASNENINDIINKQLEINAKAYALYLQKQNQLYSLLLNQSSNGNSTSKKDCLFDRNEIVEMTNGSLSAILGEKYKEADNYAIRARMPLPPFLFADKILSIDAEFGKLRPSEIVTEYTIKPDCVFRNGEKTISRLLMSESAHVGIFLMSYIGIDILSKGTLTFRAVDSSQKIVKDKKLYVGDTIKTVFRINKFMKNGSTTLLFYTCENYINNELVAVNNATGGFFTREQLSSNVGIVEKLSDEKEVSGETFPYAVSLPKKSFDKNDLRAFYQGDDVKCFGQQVLRLKEKYIENPAMYLVDRIKEIDFNGGRYHRGYICGEKEVTPDMWYFDVHFKNDPVLPAVISINGSEQTVMFFLAYSGLLGMHENTVIRNAVGNVQKSKFRGQVRRACSTLRYECHFSQVLKKETGIEIVYDIDVYNDNVKIMKLENNKKIIEHDKGESSCLY